MKKEKKKKINKHVILQVNIASQVNNNTLRFVSLLLFYLIQLYILFYFKQKKNLICEWKT